MRLLCANHSSYPRVGETPSSQRLRRAWARREVGEMSEEAYAEVVRDYVREVLDEQAAAGCDMVTDGQVHWYDLISHPASQLGGVRIDGLIRFFDTNFYVRQPEVLEPISGRPRLEDDFRYAASVSPRPVKAVLPGPYTLARFSILRGGYEGLEPLVLAYAEAIAAQLAALAEAGCGLVQLEEPFILRSPGDAALLRRALERAAAGPRPRTSLVTYFGDAEPLYRELVSMPVDMVGFDLTYSPGLAERIVREGADRPLALGAIDGRNTKLEGDELARMVERVAAALGARGVEELHLQPSCGLEFLPRDRARRKLERMAEIARLVTGVRA